MFGLLTGIDCILLKEMVFFLKSVKNIPWFSSSDQKHSSLKSSAIVTDSKAECQLL